VEDPRLLLLQGKTERKAADEILFCEPRTPNLVVESQTSNWFLGGGGGHMSLGFAKPGFRICFLKHFFLLCCHHFIC
jgi:hypothetical protein